MIHQWYTDRGLDPSASDGTQFPDTGFVVDNILASWVYKTNSSIAYIDNTVADPNSTHEARVAAQQEMLPLLMEEAARLGAKTVCTTASHESFDTLLRAANFTTLPNKYYVYLRGL